MPAPKNPFPFPCLDCRKTADAMCPVFSTILDITMKSISGGRGGNPVLSRSCHRIGILDRFDPAKESNDGFQSRVETFMVPDADLDPVGKILSPSRAELMAAAFCGGCTKHEPY